MIIQPKIRGFICTTAHPLGCAQHVREEIDYVKQQPKIEGPKRVLVIGASTGYGLSSRITSAFMFGAATIGVFFEKPASENKTGTAGWYNSLAFEEEAHKAGLYAKSINGDAFSDAIKEETIALIKEELQQVDMVVYSVAAPRRTHPKTGETFTSVLKPVGQAYSSKTVNIQTGAVSMIDLEPATEDEISQTVNVMGGEDWTLWIEALNDAGVLAEGVVTLAYSYIGPELTKPVYRNGTIGRAKDDLEATAHRLTEYLVEKQGKAYVSINKGLVTQSSSAIPVVPLYISLLYKVMKEKGLHEGCIEQITRLFSEKLYGDHQPVLDEHGYVRLDDWEMREDVQQEVKALWEQVTSENFEQIADHEGYRNDFLRLFGFAYDHVDYEQDVDPMQV